jgi:hypothetical protein
VPVSAWVSSRSRRSGRVISKSVASVFEFPCIYIYIYIYKAHRLFVQTHTHTTHARTHAHTHTHTRTHTHTHTLTFLVSVKTCVLLPSRLLFCSSSFKSGSYCTFVLLKPVKCLWKRVRTAPFALAFPDYMCVSIWTYFWTSKARKLSTCSSSFKSGGLLPRVRQYLYFCTFVLVKQVTWV